MSTIAQDLAALLSQVRRPGDFFTTGTVEFHPPRLEVDGVGPIALPLLPAQAKQIMAIAERAPYGRGTETLVDTDVRRTWQLGVDQVRITGKAWAQDLASMVARAATGLGVTTAVEAELYKLLVYDNGDFFVSHRDSEKVAGMFATMVLVLPSDYSGGELVVRHQGREARLDLHRDEPAEAAFAAFYADCVHQVLPIASGYRLALIYNLVRKGNVDLPQPPDHEAERQRAAALLRGWTESPGTGAKPSKLIYPLEHAYTEAELGFPALKGVDAAVAAVMVEAACQAECDLYLAMVSVSESGYAEHLGGWGWRSRYGNETDEFEVGEVTDSCTTLEEWRSTDGSRPELPELPFTLDELSPPDVFDDSEPDELEFQEATGNEGASFERLYRRAALVVWPRSHRIPVLGQGGLQATVPYLYELSKQWLGSGGSKEALLWQEAHGLAEQIRHDWPDTMWARQRASQAGYTATYLRSLMNLGGSVDIETFLAVQTATGTYGKEDNEALAEALGRMTPERAGTLLTAIVACNAPNQPVGCAALLAHCTTANVLPTVWLRSAALALLTAQSDELAKAPAGSHGQRRESPTAELVVDLLSALERIDPPLALRAIAQLRNQPARYGFDEILVPAALQLHEAEASRQQASVRALRAEILSHLDRRTAQPLEPPGDWRRPSAIQCTCLHCRELARFLADPSQPSWSFKAAERERRHLEASIRLSDCDLDLSTEERGRPYTLVCSKNEASYRRRLQQRRQDLEHLRRLGYETQERAPAPGA